ncbi:hypothetical protein CsatA_003906 [Cannabis sativa]
MLKRVHSLVTKDISSLNVESESDLKGARSGKSEMSPLNLLNTRSKLYCVDSHPISTIAILKKKFIE